MSIYQLKPAFQRLLRPMVRFLATGQNTANQVTLLAILISLAEGLVIAYYPTASLPLILLPLILFLRMVLNAIDGMLAREYHMQSAAGTFLNELGDVFSDTFLYLPFALIPGICDILVIFIVISSIIAEMTGVIAIQIGTERRYDGPMGKSDRAFWFAIIGLLLGLKLIDPYLINYLLGLLLLLSFLTIANRIRNALKEIKHGA